MPTVLRWNECRFYYFSNEKNELAQVHVDKGEATAKLWLEHGTIARNSGFEPRELAQICDKLNEAREQILKASPYWRYGSGQPAPIPDYKVVEATAFGDRLSVRLSDRRLISRPLGWFPRLANATADQRKVWKPCAAALGVHWPAVDEDLSVEGLLAGSDALGR